MNEDLEKYAAVWPEAQKWAGRIAREALEYGEPGEDIELNQTVATGIIAAALVAERKRCAEVARNYGTAPGLPDGKSGAFRKHRHAIATIIEAGQ